MIMRMTALIPRQDKIKETFKDKEGNDIKEYVQRRRTQGEPPSPQEAVATAQDAL